MFAARTLVPGEIVCEYRGTAIDVNPQELDRITGLYVNRGNGLVTLDPGKLVLDPYVVNGRDLTARQSYPVWANHAFRGEKGCNLELKRQTLVFMPPT